MDEGRTARGDGELQALAESARQRSGAAGVAIALLTEGKVICRGRAGSMAPGLGASAETGISGEALRQGHVLLCNDTENDDRVNVEVCRELGIRSLVLVPVWENGRAIGLVSAFSPEPNGFPASAVDALKAVAAVLVAERSAPAGSKSTLGFDAQPPGKPQLRGPLRVAIVLAGAAIIGSVAFGLFGHRRGDELRASPPQEQSTPAPVPSASPPSAASFIDGLSSAAVLGDAQAQKELGDAYALGHGVEQDAVLASAWYILAAEHGNSEARERLTSIKLSVPEVARTRYQVGRLYAAGRGTQPDRVAAYMWFVLARELGSPEAEQAMVVLRQVMTPQQVIEANRQASDWLLKHRRRR